MTAMAGSRASCALLLALLSGAAAPISAQQTVAEVCLAARVDEVLPTDPGRRARHPQVLVEALLPLAERGRWTEAMGRIQDLYRDDARLFVTGASLGPQYRELGDSLKSFAARLDAALRADTDGVDGAAQFTVEEDPNTGDFLLLDQTLRIPRESPVEQAQVLCYLGHSVQRFHELLTEPERIKAEQRLTARVARWDSWLAEGLTPLPWELAINEGARWLGRKELEPPSRQLIFLRPSPALETSGDFDVREDLLVVEVAGLVFYGEQRKRYVSASLMWGAPSGGGAGLGALVRIAPWMISAGWLRRDVDADGRAEDRVVLSVDAFELFAKAPGRLKELAAQGTVRR